MGRGPRATSPVTGREQILSPAALATAGFVVISGAQTGVDRAALDAAMALGIPCGGWCPAGRRAEDGVIAMRYPVVETERADYRDRTEANVLAADGTLVVTEGPVRAESGTACTIDLARKHGRPHLVLDLAGTLFPLVAVVGAWWRGTGGRVLNVAGPRESQSPGIGARSGEFLRRAFARIVSTHS